MNKAEAIQKMDAIGLPYNDPEADHGTAENVLLEYLRATDAADLADAFEVCRSRCNFWYS